MKGNQTENATRQMAHKKQEETEVRGANQPLKDPLWHFLLLFLPFLLKQREKMGREVEFGPCQTGNSSE